MTHPLDDENPSRIPESDDLADADESFTSTVQWFDRLKSGDEAAAEKLWQNYYARLVQLAKNKLSVANRRVADEEDLALSVIENFCRAAAGGQFPDLEDQDDLWRLLFTIMKRKAHRYIAKEKRLKRGGGAVRGDSVMDFGSALDGGIDAFAVDPLPTAEDAHLMAENVQTLLELLPDEELRAIAVGKMEGMTNEQIAKQIDCSDRTVKRKLQMIRTVWQASQHELD